MSLMVLAIGGNSLIRSGEKGTDLGQLDHARGIAAQIVGLIRKGYRIVLTHGNGPQVGGELLRSECAAGQIPGHALDICDAATQGQMGYLLEQALENEMKERGVRMPVVTLVTQCVVSLDDPAMSRPSKPVGPFYTQAEAEERRRSLGWTIVEDAKRGYRRVVPSPKPLQIVEWEEVARLADSGVLVIACGGGGIPVAWINGKLTGVEAVIDKDHTSALLASKLRAGIFVIGTDTDYVYLNYKQPAQQPLHVVDLPQLEAHALAGHFATGSMGPKVNAALQFLREGGREAIICSCDSLCTAVEGLTGTHILPSQERKEPVLTPEHVLAA